MATSTVNGAINIEGNPGNTSLANSGRPQSKSPYGAKVADANRKSSINASDGSQRRNNPQKAWTTGMNPITQRSHGPSQQNGTSKATLQKANASQETNTADQHAHDRLLFLLGNFM
ncbi:hypothetical protein MMC20_001261, partial [Loxospora ochrophaea]|nr:hypothetical protein [Loxospora ochrophaea]